MPIIACGLNHKTAPVVLRERVVFAQDKVALYLADLANNENIHEAVLLTTCNRTELYCYAENMQQAIEWFMRQHAVPAAELYPVLYSYIDEEAVRHMMSVACGLDSLVLGEPEILGQMKQAFSESSAAGCIGSLFHRLFQQIFLVAKEVRSTTAIGACPVSIASTAVSLLKKVSEKSLQKSSILLVGAGDTVELLLRHLTTLSPEKIMIANRDDEKAKNLAHKYHAESGSITQLQKYLMDADIVVSATASTLPVITKNMLTQRNTRPLLMVDLAVPRDIEAEVSELPQVKLFSIDDLTSIVNEHKAGREHAAEKARELIGKKSCEFMSWMRALDKAVSTIRAYRKQIEELSGEQLTKAMRQLRQGENPVDVLASFAHALTNKLLHAPTVQLRQAGFEGRFELLELAQQLFSIPEMELNS